MFIHHKVNIIHYWLPSIVLSDGHAIYHFLFAIVDSIQKEYSAAGINFAKPLECEAHSKREKFIPA